MPVTRPHQRLLALLFHPSVLPAAVWWWLSSLQGLGEERVAEAQPRASGLLCPALPPVPAVGTSGPQTSREVESVGCPCGVLLEEQQCMSYFSKSNKTRAEVVRMAVGSL